MTLNTPVGTLDGAVAYPSKNGWARPESAIAQPNSGSADAMT